MKILLIEDNNDLALNITEFLERKGHIVDYSADGLTALNLALRYKFDIIILDIMLPGMDGFALCEKIRENSDFDAAVIMLTAKGTEVDKLEGFRVGTDDYMVKPFSLPELEARLLALQRRGKSRLHGGKKLVVDDLEYDPNTMKLTRAGMALDLKPVPRKILVLLMQNAYRVVTRGELETEIWDGEPPDSEVLRSHIYAIRSELNKDNLNNVLHTIRGVGYMLGES
jgi:DNA-binding response OmpR family regulator